MKGVVRLGFGIKFVVETGGVRGARTFFYVRGEGLVS